MSIIVRTVRRLAETVRLRALAAAAPAWLGLILVAAPAAHADSGGNGACCLPDQMCVDLPEPICDSLGGFFRGVGTICEPTSCDPGACLFFDCFCKVVTEQECLADNPDNTFLGAGTTCNPGPETFVDAAPESIPDNTGAIVVRTIDVQGFPDAYEVSDVNVALVVTHTYVGDLCVTLEHEGLEIPLIQRSGAAGSCHQGGPFGCSSNDYNITLDSSALNDGPVEDLCGADTNSQTPTGFYVPVQSLGQFVRKRWNGRWTLRVSDNASFDTGTFESWSLTLTGNIPETYGGCCGGSSPARAGCNPISQRACCLPDGNCMAVEIGSGQTVCEQMGGIYQADTFLCVACQSCQLPDGTCVFDAPDNCEDNGGVSMVSNPNPLQGVTVYGACCFDGDACCRRLTSGECANEGGTFLGLDTSCQDCPSCVGDLNDSGAVEFQDLILLLAGWGTDGPGADLAAPTDEVDFQDLIALLSLWGPCP